VSNHIGYHASKALDEMESLLKDKKAQKVACLGPVDEAEEAEA